MNYYQKSNYNQKPNYNQRNQEPTYIDNLIKKIKDSSSLSSVLTVEEVNLPERAAYNVAYQIKNEKLETNQLRKIFEQIKSCEKYLYDIDLAKKELYKVLPLMAYAVGRDILPLKFFELLKECINENKLKSEVDINRLIEFLTSIVAYFKYFSSKRS